MKIAVIGTGYVGLVSGTCFAEFGFHVTCVDKDTQKIDGLNNGVIPIYEPGLDSLVEKNRDAGRLHFTTDLKQAVEQVDAVFIAVGTPPTPDDGHADLTYVFGAAEEIARAVTHRTVVVTKSTVPVGTGRRVLEILKKTRPDLALEVASNPEFLREGSAIEDFMRPDRVVVGAESENARTVLENLYRPLYLRETPLVVTNLETAELIKYAANGFLATKIAFINEIADVCEACGADVQKVAKGIGLDGRIGSKFLHPGPGYGGSCFPKDTLALVKTAQDFQKPLSIVEAVVEANDRRKEAMAHRVAEILGIGGSLKNKTIGVLGVTFKPNTDDMRESPALTILPALQQAGAILQAFDPAGMVEAAHLLPGVRWTRDAYEALTGVDGGLILTEWNEFRALDLTRLSHLMKAPILIDFRNIYPLKEMEQSCFVYHSIGRASVIGQQVSSAVLQRGVA